MSSEIDTLKLEAVPILKRSVTTAAGNVGGTTLVDTTLVEANDFWNECWVLLRTGTYARQLRQVVDFDQATNTITLDHGVGGQIAAGVQYVMGVRIPTVDSGVHIREALREELGGELHPIVGGKWAVKRYGIVVETVGIREGNPSVIRDGDTYRMYNARRVTSVALYDIIMRTSADGKTWSAPTIVMTDVQVNAAGFNVTGVYHPCILKENGIYYLFFAADQMQPFALRRNQIFLATSVDGVNFTGVTAVLTPRQNSMEGYLLHPWVCKFRSLYYMNCIGGDDRLLVTNPMAMRLMLYVSDDLVVWTKLDIINVEGTLGEWDAGNMYDHSLINVNDSLFFIVYAAEATAGSVNMRIGLAYTFDMTHWFGRRMLLARVLTSEASYIADTSILYEGGKLKIWYEADDGVVWGPTGQSTVRVLYAEAVLGDNHLMELWINKTVVVAGDNTDDIDTKFDKKTFHLISNQAAIVGVGNQGLFIQAYDEAAGDFKTIDSISITANTLTPYTTYYNSRRMRLRFVPSAQATVSAWVAMN